MEKFVDSDGSAYKVADKQPMKLAAMEGVYNGKNGQELIAFGILNPDKKYDNDEKEFLFDIPIPKLLSIFSWAERAMISSCSLFSFWCYPIKRNCKS